MINRGYHVFFKSKLVHPSSPLECSEQFIKEGYYKILLPCSNIETQSPQTKNKLNISSVVLRTKPFLLKLYNAMQQTRNLKHIYCLHGL